MVINPKDKSDSKSLFVILTLAVFWTLLFVNLKSTFNAYDLFFGTASHGLESEEIKDAITSSLIALVIWPLVAIIPFFMSAIVLDGLEIKHKWVFFNFLILGLIWLLCLPIGTVIGIALVVYLLWNIKKFGFFNNKQA